MEFQNGNLDISLKYTKIARPAAFLIELGTQYAGIVYIVHCTVVTSINVTVDQDSRLKSQDTVKKPDHRQRDGLKTDMTMRVENSRGASLSLFLHHLASPLSLNSQVNQTRAILLLLLLYSTL